MFFQLFRYRTASWFVGVLFIALIIVSTVSSANANQSTWKIVFEENFEGTVLDPKKWSIASGNGCPDLCGFGNKELQNYSADSLTLQNGKLFITATYKAANDPAYQSAKITTQPTGGWTYGKISVRAKLPTGVGTWPAIWMLPQKQIYGPWPQSGEIDIMEHVGYDPNIIHGTIHTESYNHIKNTHKNGQITIPTASDSFHTYSVTWEKDVMIWAVDGVEYFRRTRLQTDTAAEWPFDHAFHLILNLTVGGSWGGKKGVNASDFPATMVVDWVKVSQKIK